MSKSFEQKEIDVTTTPFERLLGRLVYRMLPLVPKSTTPNQITVAGCTIGAAAGPFFYLGGYTAPWLLVAAVAIIVHLLLDVLDGCVARERDMKSELGFFLDQFLDLVAFTAIILGISMSPFARFEIIVLGAVLYPINLAVTLHWIHLRGRWVFPIMGPSEVLAILATLTVLTYLFPEPVASLAGWNLTIMEIGFILGLITGFIETIKLAAQLILELSSPKA